MLPETHFRSARGKRLAARRGLIGLVFAAVLSLLAGMVDAIGFTLTGDFVSFMSGNTTRLAVSAGAADVEGAKHIACLLVAFVLGNALGVVVGQHTQRRAWPLLSIIALLLLLASQLPLALPSLLCAVLAMGMINAVLEEVNGLPIGLTYVTGALSRFGRGLGRWCMGQRGWGWRLQLVPWAGMLVGAGLGVVLQQALQQRALAIAGLFCLAISVGSMAIPRRWQAHYIRK